MKTVEQAWKEHGVDDDQPAHELFVYGWDAHAAETERQGDEVRHEMVCWKDQSERLYTATLADQKRIAALEAENAKLREVLTKAREDINWMVNSGTTLNGFVFDYIDAALATQPKGEKND